jgi:predicted methyltransferase
MAIRTVAVRHLPMKDGPGRGGGRLTTVSARPSPCPGCAGIHCSLPRLGWRLPTRQSLLCLLLALGACAPAPALEAHAPPAPPAKVDVAAMLAAPDRSPKDRALDAGRRPAELFAFAGVSAGMQVAEIGAWEGYTAELLARVVGPSGRVYAQDPADFDKWTHATWEERRARPSFASITRLARPFEDPFPVGTPPLDVAFSILFYHDTIWLGVDRAKMNLAIFHALKPGGVLVVADHHAKPGSGTSVAKSLHRIEEHVVQEEIERAGFVLDAEADFLRHPDDTRDWSASDEAPPEKRGTSDRFVLRFKRP